MKTKKLSLCAMLIAINVVLSLLAPIKLANFKFTFEAFPILIAGLLYGPTEGLIVGIIGSAIYQILFSGYGLMPTTPLWILPHAISGLIVGMYSKKYSFVLNNKQMIFINILNSFLVTSLNTIAIYIDAKIFGYYTFVYVFGNIIFKIISGVLLAIIYSIILPKLINRVKKL